MSFSSSGLRSQHEPPAPNWTTFIFPRGVETKRLHLTVEVARVYFKYKTTMAFSQRSRWEQRDEAAVLQAASRRQARPGLVGDQSLVPRGPGGLVYLRCDFHHTCTLCRPPWTPNHPGPPVTAPQLKELPGLPGWFSQVPTAPDGAACGRDEQIPVGLERPRRRQVAQGRAESAPLAAGAKASVRQGCWGGPGAGASAPPAVHRRPPRPELNGGPSPGEEKEGNDCLHQGPHVSDTLHLGHTGCSYFQNSVQLLRTGHRGGMHHRHGI